MGRRSFASTTQNCAPCVQATNCNTSNYYCVYPNNTLGTNTAGPLEVQITDFNNILNGQSDFLSENRNILPEGISQGAPYLEGILREWDIQTSSVGIYVDGCPGSTYDRNIFINYSNTFTNSIFTNVIPYGQKNNFLGNSLPYYSNNGIRGLTTYGGVTVSTANNIPIPNTAIVFNKTFRVIINAVKSTTRIIADGNIVREIRYKDTIVETYYADYFCNELNTSPTGTSIIIRLSSDSPDPYIPNVITKYKTALKRVSFYNYGSGQINIPFTDEYAGDYLVRLIASDNDLNSKIALDAVKW